MMKYVAPARVSNVTFYFSEWCGLKYIWGCTFKTATPNQKKKRKTTTLQEFEAIWVLGIIWHVAGKYVIL